MESFLRVRVHVQVSRGPQQRSSRARLASLAIGASVACMLHLTAAERSPGSGILRMVITCISERKEVFVVELGLRVSEVIFVLIF